MLTNLLINASLVVLSVCVVLLSYLCKEFERRLTKLEQPPGTAQD